MRHPFDRARQLIESALAARAFPAAVIDVGRAAGSVWTSAFGRLTYDAGAPVCDADTVFDLASLTKVIATASVGMRLVESGALPLDAPVHTRLAGWDTGDRRAITIRHLLDHSSGLPAHVRLFERCHGRAAFEQAIAAAALDYTPGHASIYSDLGFILLGFVLQDAGGAPLDRQFEAIGRSLPPPMVFTPAASLVPRIAPTEQDSWRGRLLVGEVHDENAAALDGVAGHAGLFGTAAGVAAFARLILETFERTTTLAPSALLREFSSRSRVPGSTRALAWDTMKITSSCGTRMSAAAIGHTGFTGTSLWIDPVQDLYVVFLTNRVHPTRINGALAEIRPPLHDAIVDAMAGANAAP